MGGGDAVVYCREGDGVVGYRGGGWWGLGFEGEREAWWGGVSVCLGVVGLMRMGEKGGRREREREPGGDRTACVACLQDVQSAPHIALAESDEAVYRVWGDADGFFLDDFIDKTADVGFFEGAEAEARAAREYGG